MRFSKPFRLALCAQRASRMPRSPQLNAAPRRGAIALTFISIALFSAARAMNNIHHQRQRQRGETAK